ncbi:MAG TPA: hypothetical protein VJ843_01115 [Candidatus Saccharimonadales bacterium]|nr:hypothetical protein [Candidatus Saccharimonadales bacterium]
MNSRNKRRLIAFLAGVGAVVILMAIAYASKSDKKDTEPSGPVGHVPVASLAPSSGALQAVDADLYQQCASLLKLSTLAVQTHHALGLQPTSGNSGSREQFDVLCNYRNLDSAAANKPIVAQTSFGTLAPYSMTTYRAVMAGDTRTGLRAHKIPTSRLPKGASDGFEFTLAGGSSAYQNPGAMLRVSNDQVVTIAFQGFDKLTSDLKRNWEYTVVQHVLGGQQ